MDQRKSHLQHYILYPSYYYDIISSTDTEVWELDTSETTIVNPTLSSGYGIGMGLFVVDAGYCRKQQKAVLMLSTELEMFRSMSDDVYQTYFMKLSQIHQRNHPVISMTSY